MKPNIEKVSAETSDCPLTDLSAIAALLPPPRRLKVRYSQLQPVLGSGLITFFGLLTYVNISSLLSSRFTTTEDIIYKGILFHGLLFMMLFVFAFAMIRAKLRAVKFIDASGVTRGDGRHFPWMDFRGRLARIGSSRYSLRYVWRIELVFVNGETAWLIPQRIKNHEEVFGFVDRLPTV